MCGCWQKSLFNGFNFDWVWRDTLFWKHKSITWNVLFVEITIWFCSVWVTSANFWKTALRALSWSSWVLPRIMASPLMFSAPGMLWICSLNSFWKISLVEFVPKFNLQYLQRPWCVATDVMYLDWGANQIKDAILKILLLHLKCGSGDLWLK